MISQQNRKPVEELFGLLKTVAGPRKYSLMKNRLNEKHPYR